MTDIEKYRLRRAERLSGRKEEHFDSVELYRQRRADRMQTRMDIEWEENDHPRDKNGKFTSGSGNGDSNKVKNNGKRSGRLNGKLKKKNSEEKSFENNGNNKRYVSAEEASNAKIVGDYKRKNSFKNGYGHTACGEKERVDMKNGLTMNQNTNENGEWTEKREELQSKIIDEFFDGKKKAEGKPVTTFLGGGPASGKTFVKNTFGEEFGIPDGCVLSDPDECKKRLPEYDQDAPWFVHEESSALAKRITKLAQENGYNRLVDGTGDGSVDKMRKKIQEAKAAGNVVQGRYVFMPIEDAIQLNHKRDRSVDPQMLIDTHKKISSILPEIAPDFDNVELYANVIGGKPKLIARGGGGRGLEILDKDLYKKFTDNGNYSYDAGKVAALERTKLARKNTKRYKKSNKSSQKR